MKYTPNIMSKSISSRSGMVDGSIAHCVAENCYTFYVSLLGYSVTGIVDG